MKLTTEQEQIISTKGNIKINAVAGSGKTTTIIEYAKTRPSTSRILYLAFNKSVKLEATRKFVEKGLTNVKVETAHSLAYKFIFSHHKYTLKSQGYKTNEIVEILNLTGDGQKHSEYILATHINRFIAYFCNSDKSKVQDLNYLDTITDSKAYSFVKSFYNIIENHTRVFLAKMNKGEIGITHDFYLKKFQLSNPQLFYDYILFDEGQDASAAMLDVFFKQKGTKVIVGDTHQQIYGWRYAVNSLEKADYNTYHLSTSFRFSKDIALLAMEVLKFKELLGEFEQIPIIGRGDSKENKTKAVIARTNLGLLLRAINYVTTEKKPKKIYFEGNINSYTYAEEGASLYDVLNLYNGKRHLIRDKLIKTMRDLDELEDYIEKTEELQLGTMVEIVKEYGNEIPSILKMIKEMHVGDNERERAEMIFSTVHRSKGMEYDVVHLVNDFITEEKLNELRDEKAPEAYTRKLNEEINLLYVAITRTRNKIYIPEPLLPNGFPDSPQIHLLKNEDQHKNEKEQSRNGAYAVRKAVSTTETEKGKSYSVAEIRETHKEAYQPWSDLEDKELKKKYKQGVRIPEIAAHFNRTTGAIRSRLKKIGLITTEKVNKK